jgi:DNA-binding response OmpR family regulator
VFRPRITDCAQPLPLDELVRRTRILVIDDAPNEFPFKVLRDQGYSIDHWPDVENLPKLESGFYDIIILDIGGVGQALDPNKEGAGVLAHLKKVNPAQIIVANSGQSHRSERIPFFKLADQYVPKPTTAITWKEILDDLLPKTQTLEHQWASLQTILVTQGATPANVRAVEKALVRAAKGKSVDITDVVTKVLGSVNNLATVASIAAKIISLCQK